MGWQFINLFAENPSNLLWNIFTSRGLLLAIVVILGGFKFWKGIANWWLDRARLIKFAMTLPGPRTLPIIGNALEFACEPEDILMRLVDVCKPYESAFRLWLGPKLYVMTTNPDDFEVILGSQQASYKGSVYRMVEPMIGQGLITGSGAKHKAHRKIITPMLNNKTLSIFTQYFDKHSQNCADLLEKEVGGREFDISSYMAHCTVDIVMDTVMGSSTNRESEEYETLLYWIERIYEILHTRLMKVWLYWDKLFFLTQLGKDHNQAINVIHSFTENIIAIKKKEHYSGKHSTSKPERPRVMLIEQLLAQTEKTEDYNDKEFRDEMWTLFTAAQDTMAVICSFAFLMLAMHPEIQDKVRAEVVEILGDETIQDKHLPGLKYLEMVIRETIRLFPIGPMMSRQLTGDVKLKNCTLPSGCSVVMVPFMTHRNPKYWKEPEKFFPERFLPENSAGRHPCANISFSSGIRSCIGQKYAIMCMKTIIANIIRRYRFSTTERMESLPLSMFISVRSRNGYKVSLSKIN